MPRRLEDIRPADHRSIHDVPTRTKKGSLEHKPLPAAESHGRHIHISKVKSDDKEPISSHQTVLAPQAHSHDNRHEHHVLPTKPRRKSTGLRWLLITVGVIVVFAGLGYIASVYFARASFTIVPKSVLMEINSTYLAQDSTQGIVAATGTIPYSFITVRGSASSTVPATIGPAVSTRAQGPVTIYNSFSAQAQRLIAGTRMANSSGKVYRLTGSVVVPGYTVSGKINIPGSTNATIIADQPGDIYNITGDSSISDFKMVAYAGTPKQNTIYARLTSPIVGGMVGTQSVVSPSVAASTTAQLRSGITNDLLKNIHTLVPSGYIMYDSGYITSFSTTTTTNLDKTHSMLSVQGSVSGMIFKKIDLVNRLAGPTAASSFGSFKYDTSSLETLDVTVVNSSSAPSTGSSSTTVKQIKAVASKPVISMKIKGTVKLVGIVPVDELIKKLLGKTSVEAQNVFKQYNQVIDKIDGEVMPPWSKIPTNPARISIVVKG